MIYLEKINKADLSHIEQINHKLLFFTRLKAYFY